MNTVPQLSPRLRHLAPAFRNIQSWMFQTAAAILVASPTLLFGQQSATPWISGLPGLEHPASWSLESTAIVAGIQRAAKWNEGHAPLEAIWLGAGWHSGMQTNGYRRGRNSPAIGLAVAQDPQAHGWKQTDLTCSASVNAPLSRHWTGAAGIGLGMSHWRLDPMSWSWDAQYGPQGYDPLAPSGENGSTGASAGWKWASTMSIAVQSKAKGTARKTPEISGAASLRHLIPGKSPHLSLTHADTVQWMASWWMEAKGAWSGAPFSWRIWHRGAWQGASVLGEWGISAGTSFGKSSRFTNANNANEFALGILVRTEGTMRATIQWQRGAWRCWMGPGWTYGTLWRPPPGWALALAWSPSEQGGVPLRK